MSGWIRIERDLFDKHPFFDAAPMSDREAWVWMIAKAAWDDTRHKVGKDMLDVPRGSFMVTLRELQSTFMWGSDTRVRNFLKRLESEGMIERTAVGSRNAPKTHVTISNYSKFQNIERTKAFPKTHRERTKNAVKEQENNITRDTNVSQDAKAIAILAPIVSEPIAIAFAEHRRSMGKAKALTENAATAMVKKLDGHHDPGAVLNDSIANGWQGIFPDKIKPQFKTINGGQNERPHQNTKRIDPALEQIARLARIGAAPSDGRG